LGREAGHSPPFCAEVRNGEAIPPLPHNSSWHSAELIKHRENFVFTPHHSPTGNAKSYDQGNAIQLFGLSFSIETQFLMYFKNLLFVQSGTKGVGKYTSSGDACPLLSLLTIITRKMQTKVTVVITKFCICLPVRHYNIVTLMQILLFHTAKAQN
jgi:hypothetical protein